MSRSSPDARHALTNRANSEVGMWWHLLGNLHGTPSPCHWNHQGSRPGCFVSGAGKAGHSQGFEPNWFSMCSAYPRQKSLEIALMDSNSSQGCVGRVGISKWCRSPTIKNGYHSELLGYDGMPTSLSVRIPHTTSRRVPSSFSCNGVEQTHQKLSEYHWTFNGALCMYIHL